MVSSATLGHPLMALFTHGRTTGLTLGRDDIAVAVRVEAGEGGLGAGLGLSDHHRAAGLCPALMAGTVHGRAVGTARAALGAGVSTVLTRRVELGLADRAVIIGVEPVEAVVAALGHAGLGRAAHLIAGDRAVTVGVGGGQALNAAIDELRPAEAAVAIGVSTHGAGLTALRCRLCGREASGGEGQNGQAGGQKGRFHLNFSVAA